MHVTPNSFRANSWLVSLINLHLLHLERWLLRDRLVLTYREDMGLQLRKLVEMLHSLMHKTSSMRKRARCSIESNSPVPETKLSL
jgi:hypothetical protein